MAALDHQLGLKAESTYGTPVVVDSFYEYDSEGIEETAGRTEGDPLRAGGAGVLRSDRFTPYFSGAAGNVSMAVMTKGFGKIFEHCLGANSTGAAADGKTVHTSTLASTLGKSLTVQVNRPFHPTGTNQAFTYEGGKVTEWTLSNSVEDNLMLELGLDFEQVSTATGLATASYPTSMENFTWAGGVITVGGTAFDVTEFTLSCNNGLDVDRRQIRGNTDKKEPTQSRRELTFSLKADFESLAQRARVLSATRAGALAAITATWTAPTLIGASSYPTLTVTIPAARFDAWGGATEGTDPIEQELTGVLRWDGTNSAVSIAYGSADVTA